MLSKCFSFLLFAALVLSFQVPAQSQTTQPAAPPVAVIAAATPPAGSKQKKSAEVGEKIPSEDPIIVNLHSLGLINGQTDIYRSACPVRDLAKKMDSLTPSPELLADAKVRMKHLYDLGIRTVISFQRPASPDGQGKSGKDGKPEDQAACVALEKAAAEQAGLHFVNFPMANSGPGSMEDMSDTAVLKWLEQVTAEIFSQAKDGGVVFHCSAGHDRAGITAAYLRMKYQHWPVDQAIDEMRRLGHNWVKYSNNGGQSSWHEEHLQAIAKLMAAGQ